MELARQQCSQRRLASRPGPCSTRSPLQKSIHCVKRLRQHHAVPATAEATTTSAAHPTSASVHCTVEKTSWNSRKLLANVAIQAPVNTVWGCLTDYEGLSTFIPSLVENRCLQAKESGAIVYQVGAQDVAMGVRFSAACTLDCTEYPSGVPGSLCSTSGDGSDGLLPYPNHSMADAPAKDITFVLIDGDFKAFRGVWRMQPLGGPASSQGSAGSSTSSFEDAPATMLCYSLYVQPQAWLPVGLVQSRIEKEVLRNLDAVRRHAEKLHRKGGRASSSTTGGSSSSE